MGGHFDIILFVNMWELKVFMYVVNAKQVENVEPDNTSTSATIIIITELWWSDYCGVTADKNCIVVNIAQLCMN